MKARKNMGKATAGGAQRRGLSMTPASGSRMARNYGMQDFSAFQNRGDGTFTAPNGFDFTHAWSTTNDRPTSIATRTGTQQPVQGRSAGDLWQKCTGKSIRESTCAVQNCTNPNCSAENPQPAGATAHVYLRSQTPNKPIEYMALMPTCSGCNNHGRCSSSNTNYPLKGQRANVLQARPGTQIMPVRIDDSTARRKGEGKGRGDLQGGRFGAPYRRGGGNGSSSGRTGGKGSGSRKAQRK